MPSPDGIIDLRSDTVTRPTPAMRAAMAAAVVGDDVYGEDPTVLALEELAAGLVGQEAGLFVASGRMSNLVALLTHARPGAQILAGAGSHVVEDEAGSLAALAGLAVAPVTERPDGTFDLEELAARISHDEFADTRVVCLENSHGGFAGAPISTEHTRAVVDLAHARGVAVHLDGARLFNAAAALDVPAESLAWSVDSVGVCLSKGLCAPVGSVLCGGRGFVEEARRWRRRVGGAMRQAGVLAAAGLVALRTMRARLVDDHAHAAALAEGLHAVAGLTVTPPRTNLVGFTLTRDANVDGPALVAALRTRGVRIDLDDPTEFRAATHLDVTADDVATAVVAFLAVLGARSA